VPAHEVQKLRCHRLVDIERHGKYLVLVFGDAAPHSLLLHLGMSGQIRLAPAATRPRWTLHEHWRLRFGPSMVRYVDPRRFGALLTCPRGRARAHPLLARLGPDPLEAGFGPQALSRASRGSRATLKSFLLDGRRVAGIGNIYACEACFEARIRPTARVHRLDRQAWNALCNALRVVLHRALAAGGTSIRDYVDARGEPGWFQHELRVYGREGRPCSVCSTAIRVRRDAGRSTYYCPGCQRSVPSPRGG
jgi:formamidopyrimidine-DNA glycosylase